jgi:hypothetical protein
MVYSETPISVKRLSCIIHNFKDNFVQKPPIPPAHFQDLTPRASFCQSGSQMWLAPVRPYTILRKCTLLVINVLKKHYIPKILKAVKSPILVPSQKTIHHFWSRWNGEICKRVLLYSNFISGCETCRCDPVGSYNKSCDVKTGQCHNKPGVGALTADQCMANFYGFSYEGCSRKFIVTFTFTIWGDQWLSNTTQQWILYFQGSNFSLIIPLSINSKLLP